MADSLVAYVDQIAASDLARDLDLDLAEDQMLELAKRLAKHRTSTIDLAVSRIQAKISDAVFLLLRSAQSYRSQDWSDGCRQTEGAVLGITSAILSEIRPPAARSKGRILRDMLRNARKQKAVSPQYTVVPVEPQSTRLF